MGLCKCPKKRVTQHFCFEHRVNVCEFCMINNHPACIVQPYLQWLEDSSFKPKCSFCQLNLSNEECVRLLCYHVFHWTCFNKFYSSLPSNTAPAGYTCPDCNIPIFPNTNNPSPIFTVLKKKLSLTDWARIGLGLPISSISTKSASIELDKKKIINEQEASNKVKYVENEPNIIQKTLEQEKNFSSSVFIHHNQPEVISPDSQSIPVPVNTKSNYFNNQNHHNNYSNLSHNNVYYNSSSRKNFLNNSNERELLFVDIDEDKYRSRSLINTFSRYLKFLNYKHNLTFYKRWLLSAIMFCLALFTVFYILIKVGRSSANNDPLLDPKYNPNIHLQDIDDINQL